MFLVFLNMMNIFFIIIDNFFKTKENILAGSKAFIMFMDKKEKSYQLKGFVKYEKQAIYFENMKKMEYKITSWTSCCYF